MQNSEISTKQTYCWQHTKNTAVLPIAGQKFPRCFVGIWNFSRYVKTLSVYSMMSWGTLYDALWNPAWDSSNILKFNTLRFGNGIGPCLQACFLYNKMLLQNT